MLSPAYGRKVEQPTQTIAPPVVRPTPLVRYRPTDVVAGRIVRCSGLLTAHPAAAMDTTKLEVRSEGPGPGLPKCWHSKSTTSITLPSITGSVWSPSRQNNTLSLSLWFRTNMVNPGAAHCGFAGQGASGKSWYVRVDKDSGKLCIGQTTSAGVDARLYTSAGKMNDNVWRHLYVYMADNRLEVYINAELVHTDTATISTWNKTSTAAVGCGGVPSDYGMTNGQLGAIELFFAKLTQAEVSLLYDERL